MARVYKRVTTSTTKRGRVRLVSAHKINTKCKSCKAWSRRLTYAIGKRTETVHSDPNCPGIYHYHSLQYAAVSRHDNETIMAGFSDCELDVSGGCNGGQWFEPSDIVSDLSLHHAEQAYHAARRDMAAS